MHDEEWQDLNRSGLTDRLQTVGEFADGTIFSEPSGAKFVVVTKEDQHLCLWMHDEANVNTGVIQSELDLGNPLALVDAYTQATLLALLWIPEPERIFTTGLGGGCLPLVLHHHLTNSTIDCVESDALVAEVAQRFFGIRPDARLKLAINDGRDWLTNHAAPGHYDLLFIDAFDDHGDVPAHLTTVEFFELCRSRLQPAGLLIVNLLYLDPHRNARIKTISQLFDHLYLCAMGDDNDVLFASRQPLPDEGGMVERAVALKTRYHFAFPYVRHALKLKALVIGETTGWDRVPILTDQGRPISSSKKP